MRICRFVLSHGWHCGKPDKHTNKHLSCSVWLLQLVLSRVAVLCCRLLFGYVHLWLLQLFVTVKLLLWFVAQIEEVLLSPTNAVLPSVLWHCWLGSRKGIRPAEKMGGWRRWALVSPGGVAPSRMVGVSASVNLPLHHKVQKFSSGTGSSGWSRRKGRKMVVCGIICCYVSQSSIITGWFQGTYICEINTV